MEKNGHILLTKGLSKYFGGLHALNKLNIAAEKGQIHGLIAPNGSGKTTFFNVVTGILPATEGKVYFESTDITNLKSHITAKRLSESLESEIGVEENATRDNFTTV